VRIISGEFRRRKILANPGNVTRPITDRVKETLFELLGDIFVGARVADVFSGTGTLGLEALSRGAASVVFIENDRRAHQLLSANVRAFKVEDRSLCWRSDVLRCSFQPKGAADLLPYDVVFFDPPYAMLPKIRPRLPLYKSLERLARPAVTAPDAVLLVRTPEDCEWQWPPCWHLEGTLVSMSGMEVLQFRKTDGEEPAQAASEISE
jgi:16S rRNA (guanine966-N2)-methyltransferase